MSSQCEGLVVFGNGLHSTSSMIDKPINLKKFEVVKVLGTGEYAKVVLVYDRAIDQHFAVKIIPQGRPFIRDTTIEELMFEKQILEKLSGRDCFGQCFFTALTLTHAWFCFKYYPGGSLKDFISNLFKTETKLAFRDAQYILAELVCAIGEMHSHGILHRDIKDDNVMIDEEGHMVLIDFGLSVVLDTTTPLCEQVYREQFNSGCYHIAPEMTEVPASYSYPSDLYALGVLVGLLCCDDVLDVSVCSSNRRNAAADLEAALTKKKPCQRATITDVTSHRFFQGIRWEDVTARKLDMTKFRPIDTVTQQKSKSGLYADLGNRTIPSVVDPRLRDFCSFGRYRRDILKE